jgi:hypothetical protein
MKAKAGDDQRQAQRHSILAGLSHASTEFSLALPTIRKHLDALDDRSEPKAKSPI